MYGRYAWDQQDGGADPLLVRQVVDGIVARRRNPGESILDAGCGTGNTGLALARAGFRVTGIDSAAGMLARARSDELCSLLQSSGYRVLAVDPGRPIVIHGAASV